MEAAYERQRAARLEARRVRFGTPAEAPEPLPPPPPLLTRSPPMPATPTLVAAALGGCGGRAARGGAGGAEAQLLPLPPRDAPRAAFAGGAHARPHDAERPGGREQREEDGRPHGRAGGRIGLDDSAEAGASLARSPLRGVTRVLPMSGRRGRVSSVHYIFPCAVHLTSSHKQTAALRYAAALRAFRFSGRMCAPGPASAHPYRPSHQSCRLRP